MNAVKIFILALALIPFVGDVQATHLDSEEGWEKLYCYPLIAREIFMFHEGKLTNRSEEMDRDMVILLNIKARKIVVETFDKEDQVTEYTITNVENYGWTDLGGFATDHKYKDQGISEIIHLSLRHDKKDPNLEGVTAILYRASTSLFGIEAEVAQCIYSNK